MRSVLATRKIIDPSRRKGCFELFGYDFIIDEDFNTWLIEVNTNPCIEESSGILKILLPRMIDDMLKLSVDQYFQDFQQKKKENSDLAAFQSQGGYETNNDLTT
jgi:Tubulin-tyrosine ligase family